MDQSSFDRIARLLGGAASRRAGLGAALGGLLGLAALDGADAGRNKGKDKDKDKGKDGNKDRVRPEGPCGNGSRKDNACTKDKQCCTGLCNRKVGKKNLDGKGRCRCVKKNGKCKEDRNCCSRKGQELACVDGVCTGGGGLIPTSEACTEGGTACEDPNASCTTYDEGSDGPAGTYCLLPFLEKTCAKAADCGCNSCYDGTCLTCGCSGCPDATACAAPKVCASGCAHTTVQAAVDAAASGDTITIGPGTYNEDVTIAGKNISLLGCPRNGDVIIKNATLQTRTIDVTDTSDLIINDIVIQGFNDQSNYGGGVATAGGDLCVGMRSRVENCSRVDNTNGKGGGIFTTYDTVTTSRYNVHITDAVIIQNNQADSYGGGVDLDSYADTVIDGHVLITNNTCVGDCDGGGVAFYYGQVATIVGYVRIIGNHAGNAGGGIHYYGGGTKPSGRPYDLLIGGRVEFSGNTAGDVGGEDGYGAGLAVEYGDLANGDLFILEGNAVITGNTVSGPNARGGGAYLDSFQFHMKDNARIIGNTAELGKDTYSAYGGGIYFEGNDLDKGDYVQISGSAEISGNAAPQGGGIYFPDNVKFAMSDNAVIRSNTATDGGGIFFYSDGHVLTFAGSAAITGNTATGGGGGIWIDTTNPMSTTGYNSPAIFGNTPNQCQNSDGVCP